MIARNSTSGLFFRLAKDVNNIHKNVRKINIFRHDIYNIMQTNYHILFAFTTSNP